MDPKFRTRGFDDGWLLNELTETGLLELSSDVTERVEDLQGPQEAAHLRRDGEKATNSRLGFGRGPRIWKRPLATSLWPGPVWRCGSTSTDCRTIFGGSSACLPPTLVLYCGTTGDDALDSGANGMELVGGAHPGLLQETHLVERQKRHVADRAWLSCAVLLHRQSCRDGLPLQEASGALDVLESGLTDSGWLEFERRNGKRWHVTESKFQKMTAALEPTTASGTAWTSHQLEVLLGHITSALPLRSETLAMLSAVYRFAEDSEYKRQPLWRLLRRELRWTVAVLLVIQAGHPSSALSTRRWLNSGSALCVWTPQLSPILGVGCSQDTPTTAGGFTPTRAFPRFATAGLHFSVLRNTIL